MNNISVLILAKNEETDLPACLDSVAWSDDVHVLDSYSSDSTLSIAKSRNANVSQRVFDGYASQRNAGLQLAFKYQWIFILDADERIPKELANEIQSFVATAPDSVDGASIRRRDIWWGRWLSHAQISPFYVRLVRKGKIRYEREINEVLVVDGEVRTLSNFFDHFPFSKGLDHWIHKHNIYSRMEAEVCASGSNQALSWRIALLGRDFHQRRLHQKAIFYKLPCRPLIKFFYMMIARRAFMDGWPGIRYAILQSIYEYFIILKTKELMEKDSRA